MKTQEFRKLIREEIRKILKEKKSLTEAGAGSLYQYIVGTPNDDGKYRDDIEDGVAKMPKKLQVEWDELMDSLSRANNAEDHIPELKFYIKHKQYFSDRLVKMCQDILTSISKQ